MTERDELRVDKALQGADFPSSREDLLAYARERVHDSPKTLHALAAIPDREYANKDEVISAVPQEPEGEDTPGGLAR